jgi:membrane protein YqaA with SNARE-associated domain
MSAYNEKILSAFIKALGMCVSTGIASYLMWKFLEHSDPHKESKKKAKRKVSEQYNRIHILLIWVFQLEDLLNLDPKIELNSHEMRLANQIGKCN